MKFFITFLLVFLCAIQAASACSPPPPNYKFRTTAEKIEGSSYVIMGRRHLTGLRKISGIGPSYNYDTGEPGSVEIQVFHVLKGDLEEDIITVRTSFGMCGSAFIFDDDQPHIMLLSHPNGDDGIYQPNGGYNDSPNIASRKNQDTGVYEAHDDAVDGYIPIETFITRYDLRALPTPLNQ